MTERRAITVRGTVQGVGFRPYVFQLASRCRLAGFVRNQSGSVQIEIEGDRVAVDRFCRELPILGPPLASIDELSWRSCRCVGEQGFHITTSTVESGASAAVSPDVATCDECLQELFDPGDRRYRYPFLNCSNCGPRLTIVQGAPYDRQRTSMASFTMCPQCRSEYEQPSDRRFHAQATCCPHCGPRLSLLDHSGQPIETSDAVRDFVSVLRQGFIGALKGLGGYHLACDAANERAVCELRARKQRDDKPFAIMVRDIPHARRYCTINAAERALLMSPQRPIVLLRRRNANVAGGVEKRIAAAVAPDDNPHLGVMLPYTPLHHLIINEVAALPLVMTSGNRSDEPIAYQDEVGVAQLNGIADVFLTHDREIRIRCDDSVTRVLGGVEYPVRRSRGYAPRPIKLPNDCRDSLLAVGGQLKATFALGSGTSAIVSHHLGDLDDYEAFCAYQRDVRLYEELYNIHPQWIVHDLHPDYISTDYAQRRGAADGVRTLAVQHHHAHIASCMAENDVQGEVIGVAFDGTGYGTDGAIWGGEFLIASYTRFRRAAHLRYVNLPGGDRAIREPWRSAAAHLVDAECDLTPLNAVASPHELRIVQQMIAQGVNSPRTSSMGRLFDAVAALGGIHRRASFEGQAAMKLEWLATHRPACGTYPLAIETLPTSEMPRCYEIDARPMIRAIADDVRRATDEQALARRFQSTLVEMIDSVCRRLREDTGLNDVVLSGGVFMNVLLTREATARLTHLGFRVWRHRLVPPNDGGLSLGQLAVAAASQDLENGQQGEEVRARTRATTAVARSPRTSTARQCDVLNQHS